MAFAETQKLIVDLSLKGNFSQQIRASQTALGKLDKSIISTQGRAYKAGTQIGTGIQRGAIIAAGAIGFLALNVEKGLASLSKLDDVVAQTNAVLKSTKGAAGENAAAIRDLANKYEALNATIDDTVIQSGENLLLTFTNIRKKAFEPTLAAALDMNQALGGGEAGLQGTIQRLGKALNDPIKGLTALQRVGVTFTAQQKKQIQTAIDAGDTFKAQSIILAELQKRFGGSFLAGGQTTTGKVAKFKDAIDDLQRVLAKALLPVIGKVADAMTKFLADPAVIKGVNDLGESIAGLFSDKNLATGADFLKGAFETAKDAAPVVAGAAKATFALVQGAVSLFKSLPPEIQKLAVGAFAVNKLTGGLVTNIAGGIIDTVGKQFLQRGGTPANPLFVADVTGGLGKGLGAAAGAAEGAAATAGGLSLGTVAIAAAVPVVLIGGTALSLKAIGEAADKNNELAAKGLSFNEIKAYKFYTASQAWQQQAIKQGQTQPTKADFDSALEKLGQTTTADTHSENVRIASAITDGLKNNIGVPIGGLLRGAAAQLAATKALGDKVFRGVVNGLNKAKGPDIAKAVANAVKLAVTDKRGGVSQTKALIDGLKKQLGQTHDPKLQSLIRSALAKIEAKLPNRVYAAQAVAKADKILHSSESVKRKITDLNAIENDLKNHKLPGQARALQKKIDDLKKAQVAAANKTTEAARLTTESIKDKDLSVTVNTPPVNVSIRDVVGNTRTYSRYGNVAI